VQHASDWTQASDEAIALADESGDDNLRMAIRAAGSYAYLCAGDFEHCERLLDEALEIAGDDHTVGAGIVIGCPYAWALMAKGFIRRDRGEFDPGVELCETALRIAGEQGDPETESWTRGQLAGLLALRGDLDEALGLAQRNYELTERLGDVFSRHWALVNMAYVRVQREDWEDALDSLERADRLYREAMGNGGEAEGWRETMIAESLLGVGRVSEAVERAEHAAAICRDRAMNWALPLALRNLAKVRIAAGKPGVHEILDEAETVAEGSRMVVELEGIRELREAAAAR
jgi:tetratricopeptide (TPR) repeat protein